MRRREPTASRSDEKRRQAGLIAACACLVWVTSVPAGAQDDPRLFAGAVAGVSALSADARSVTNGSDAALSLYDPGLGPALNVFGGIHLAKYFSIQANWMWNRNDI